jgi:hypothetical protein
LFSYLCSYNLVGSVTETMHLCVPAQLIPKMGVRLFGLHTSLETVFFNPKHYTLPKIRLGHTLAALLETGLEHLHEIKKKGVFLFTPPKFRSYQMV